MDICGRYIRYSCFKNNNLMLTADEKNYSEYYGLPTARSATMWCEFDYDQLGLLLEYCMNRNNRVCVSINE